MYYSNKLISALPWARQTARSLPFLYLLICTILLLPVSGQATKLIRFATLAPEGSSWMQTMHQIDADLKTATNGEISFKFYPNMTMGDEKDVLLKIRLGQLQGGGFTGFGLGEVLPEVRILELPYIFENDDQLDFTVAKLTDRFKAGFAAKGYILLGWTDVGWIYFMARKPVAEPSDLTSLKVWMWQGDPLANAFYLELGKTPVPLPVTDVMMSLQTGMLDAVYGSALSTLVLQWYSKLSYISDIPFTNASGAVLLDKKTFDGLTEAQQKSLLDIAGKRLRELTLKSRQDNRQAYEELQKQGLKKVPSTPTQRDQMKKIGLRVQNRLAGTLYSKELLDLLHEITAEAKSQPSTSPPSKQ